MGKKKFHFKKFMYGNTIVIKKNEASETESMLKKKT